MKSLKQRFFCQSGLLPGHTHQKATSKLPGDLTYWWSNSIPSPTGALRKVRNNESARHLVPEWYRPSAHTRVCGAGLRSHDSPAQYLLQPIIRDFSKSVNKCRKLYSFRSTPTNTYKSRQQNPYSLLFRIQFFKALLYTNHRLWGWDTLLFSFPINMLTLKMFPKTGRNLEISWCTYPLPEWIPYREFVICTMNGKMLTS